MMVTAVAPQGHNTLILGQYLSVNQIPQIVAAVNQKISDWPIPAVFASINPERQLLVERVAPYPLAVGIANLHLSDHFFAYSFRWSEMTGWGSEQGGLAVG
jgi:hypothetical protein